MTAQINRSTNSIPTDFRKLEREISRSSAVISRSAKEFFDDPVKGNKSGLAASATLLAEQLRDESEKIERQLEETAIEEKRILDLRAQQYRQFFQQDFMQNTSAGQAGAPDSAANSALLRSLKETEEQTKRNAVAATELAKERARLTASYNPLAAAEQQYLRMQQEIHRASELGVLDAKQQVSALRQLDREYETPVSYTHLTLPTILRV